MTILISFLKKLLTEKILIELLKSAVGKAVLSSLLEKVKKEITESDNKIDDAVFEVLLDTLDIVLEKKEEVNK